MRGVGLNLNRIESERVKGDRRVRGWGLWALIEVFQLTDRVRSRQSHSVETELPT